MSKVLRLACIDSEAPPLFSASPDGISRGGYEPEAAALVLTEAGYQLSWQMMPWDEMLPAVRNGKADAVWCGQGITQERAAQVDFTEPYAIFNETLLVRAGDPVRTPEALEGHRIGAIAGSTNMKLAETFPGAELVPFGSSEDVFGDMIAALRSGEIDGFVDDDVVTIPLGEDPDFDVAFTAQTANRWGVGVAPGNTELLNELNTALQTVIADGRLVGIWRKWMPLLPFPLSAENVAATQTES